MTPAKPITKAIFIVDNPEVGAPPVYWTIGAVVVRTVPFVVAVEFPCVKVETYVPVTPLYGVAAPVEEDSFFAVGVEVSCVEVDTDVAATPLCTVVVSVEEYNFFVVGVEFS
jgi:hypothetical protein